MHSGSQLVPKDAPQQTVSIQDLIHDDDPVSTVRVVNDSNLDIVRGLVEGKTFEHRFMLNPIVPNGSFADIWAYGPTDPTYNWPTTTEGFRIKAGGNINDTAAGTGAREITIEYLDGSGNQVTETLATAGASASASTVGTGRRINRVWVSKSGTYGGSNTGPITIENDVTNEVVAYIDTGHGQTYLSQFTVPLNFEAVIQRIELNIATGANKDADVRLWTRDDAYVVAAPFGGTRSIRQWIGVQGIIESSFGPTIRVPSLSDIWLDAKGNGATTSVACEIDITLVNLS